MTAQVPDDSIPTRQSLLLRLKKLDDTAGWHEFFETYWELIYNVPRKTGLSHTEAQDAVQETVIAVARKIGEFEVDARRGSFKSWLLGQARWRIGDQFRARARANRLSGEIPIGIAGSTSRPWDDNTGTEPLNQVPDPAADRLAAVWNGEWEQHVMRVALERVKARVSVKQFQMFDLHIRQGLSVVEAARATGATKAAIYMAKTRVGRLFRREVQALSAQ